MGKMLCLTHYKTVSVGQVIWVDHNSQGHGLSLPLWLVLVRKQLLLVLNLIEGKIKDHISLRVAIAAYEEKNFLVGEDFLLWEDL